MAGVSGAQSSAPQNEIAPVSSFQKRIVLVIPGRLFRDCIHRVLLQADRVVTGACDTLEQAESVLDTLAPPDLIVVGFVDREKEQFDDIRRLRAKLPDSRWIVLSKRTGVDVARDAIEAGVDGLLLEDSPGEILQLVTGLVLLGQNFIPAELARLLYAGAAAVPPRPMQSSPVQISTGQSLPIAALPEPNGIRSRRGHDDSGPIAPGGGLSDRERQILSCLGEGHSNKVIARQLQIAESTVKVHVKALLRKMQVANRTQAALLAPQFLHGAHRQPDHLVAAVKTSGETPFQPWRRSPERSHDGRPVMIANARSDSLRVVVPFGSSAPAG